MTQIQSSVCIYIFYLLFLFLSCAWSMNVSLPMIVSLYLDWYLHGRNFVFCAWLDILRSNSMLLAKRFK